MSVLTELESVLDDERQLLLSGDFAGLGDLIARKEQLVARLAGDRPEFPADQYKHLVNRAHHNDALLGSAQRGLQAAMTQLKQASDGEHQSTYSKRGERRPLTGKPASLKQKL